MIIRDNAAISAAVINAPAMMSFRRVSFFSGMVRVILSCCNCLRPMLEGAISRRGRSWWVVGFLVIANGYCGKSSSNVVIVFSFFSW